MARTARLHEEELAKKNDCGCGQLFVCANQREKGREHDVDEERSEASYSEETLTLYVEGHPSFSVDSLLILPLGVKLTP